MAGNYETVEAIVDGWVLEYLADHVIRGYLSSSKDAELWAEVLQGAPRVRALASGAS